MSSRMVFTHVAQSHIDELVDVLGVLPFNQKRQRELSMLEDRQSAFGIERDAKVEEGEANGNRSPDRFSPRNTLAGGKCIQLAQHLLGQTDADAFEDFTHANLTRLCMAWIPQAHLYRSRNAMKSALRSETCCGAISLISHALDVLRKCPKHVSPIPGVAYLRLTSCN